MLKNDLTLNNLKPGLVSQAGNIFFQPKLTINHPNDKYEQEADSVSEKLVQMDAATLQKKLSGNPFFKAAPLSINSVKRKCAHCEPEEKQLQRKELNKEETVAGNDIEHYVSGLNGNGQSLPAEVRNFYEPRFGYDFSNVKLHTDHVAAKSARSINALAYTSGNNIVFNSGQYSPGTDSGKRLLGHELTHVVQQSDKIQPYRTRPENDTAKDKSKSFNFGLQDDVGLVEDSFKEKTDKETKPWIELIEVEFTKLEDDTNGIATWKGKAAVKYYDNAVKKPGFTFDVTGGSKELGKTDAGNNFKVTRIEGVGYNSGKYSGKYDKTNREGPSKRYSKDLNANMSFAVFYNGGEALHAGPLDWSSHGCVHVDFGPIQQVNYHSVINLTKVKVKYP